MSRMPPLPVTRQPLPRWSLFLRRWELLSSRIYQMWASLRRPWLPEPPEPPDSPDLSLLDRAIITDFGGVTLVTVSLHAGNEAADILSTWADYQVELEDTITFWLKHKPTLTVSKGCMIAIDRQSKKDIVGSAIPAKHS